MGSTYFLGICPAGLRKGMNCVIQVSYCCNRDSTSTHLDNIKSVTAWVKLLDGNFWQWHSVPSLLVGRVSWVGVATRYGLDGPGNESRRRRDFPHPSRPVLRPPIQWVPRLFPGGKAAGSWRWPPTPYSAQVKESRAISLLHLWVFVACYGVNVTFTFTFTCYGPVFYDEPFFPETSDLCFTKIRFILVLCHVAGFFLCGERRVL